MAEGNGGKFLGGGFGQILTTVLSALVMTLLVWAWNLTQDVRVLMDSRPKLAQIEEILENARARGRTELVALANRMAKSEQIDAGRERELAGVYTQLHELAMELSDAKQEISSMQATIQFLARNHGGRPPPER